MVTLLTTIFNVAVQLAHWTTYGLCVCMAATSLGVVSVVMATQRWKHCRAARAKRLEGDAAETGGHLGRRAAASAWKKAPDTRSCQGNGGGSSQG